jgi:hypothetical protein
MCAMVVDTVREQYVEAVPLILLQKERPRHTMYDMENDRRDGEYNAEEEEGCDHERSAIIERTETSAPHEPFV